MASATLGSAYTVTDEDVETLIGLEGVVLGHAQDFVSRRASSDRLADIAAKFNSGRVRSGA